MRFKGFNLNLLTALQALLEERNVSTAARRVFLSQSAMSGVLSQLRDQFGDPLLEMSGRRMILTPFAESLIEPLAETMRHIETLVSALASFEPAMSRRHFSIATSDYVLSIVMPHLMTAIAKEAPGVSLTVSLPVAEPGMLLNRGDIDMVVTPEGFVTLPHMNEFFCNEDYVVVGGRDNPLLQRTITVADIENTPHVMVRFTPDRSSYAENELKRLGITPPVAAIVPTFRAAPLLLPGTGYISVLQRRLALSWAREAPLTIKDLPVEIPPMRELMLYHPLRAQDAGLAWLRARFHDALRHFDSSVGYQPLLDVERVQP
jgi:DNA-binding transcriptional LysR family regulator